MLMIEEKASLDIVCCTLCQLNVGGLWEEDPHSWGDNSKKLKQITTFIYLISPLISLL